jgi:NAD(P)-dependent dehydrogenase (short-subunit alcohol dehydrogenase family)
LTAAADRIGVITGANSGIGKAAAIELARTGMQLGLVCRNEERGRPALDEIRQITGNDRLTLFSADFASLDAVRRLATEIQERLPALDLLVNNAGCYRHQRTLTTDGFETVFAVNHLAPYLLTRMLLPTLNNNTPARIVNVASDAHFRGTIDFDDLDFSERRYRWFPVYCQSKLGNVLTSAEMLRRLQADGHNGIQVFAMHPGVVNTGLFRTKHPIDLGIRLVKRFLLSPKVSARAICRLATDSEFNDIPGGYFDRDRAKKPSREARDEHVARKLWEISAQQVGL